ncbi:MAG TPA: hypothetical protein DCZ72_11010 [Armatimonadetes bacterium]|nr:hypothetical protein [Armatimonadota bacterium]
MRVAGYCLVVWAALVLAAMPARAEFPDGFNHPEVSWREFETENFVIVFNEGLEQTATLAGQIAERIHPGVCEIIGAEPRAKTTIVLADYDDVAANNFARRLQHVIYLYNPIVNQARVDRESWLTALITHEYAHVVNGWGLRIAGGFAGVLTEWAAMEYQPQWFTEGLAEYVAHGGQIEPVTYVHHAAHQGELLSGAKLDVADMRFDVIETGTVYRQGHAMCNLLAERFGPDIFARLVRRAGAFPQWDIAFQTVTGTSTAAFTREALARFRAEAAAVPAEEPLDTSAEHQATPGLVAALAATPSPDGRFLAVYGIADWEEPIASLWLYARDGSGRRKLDNTLGMYASWKVSWSPDSRQLVYMTRHRNRQGSVTNELARYDVERGRRELIGPAGWRLGEPEFSPSGQYIVATAYRDEQVGLVVLDSEGQNPRWLTAAVDGDCFSPTWSPDETRIAFSLTSPAGTDLAVINTDGSGFARLTTDAWPDQYPAWSPDGQHLAFVSYRQETAATGGGRSAAVAGEAEGLSGSGTNVYLLPVEGGEPTQLTAATTGGVFYPSWSADGTELFVSLFKVRKATIHALALQAAEPVAPVTDQLPPTAALPVAQESAPVTESRGYRAAGRFKPYAVRPFNRDDGLGSSYGLRAHGADPLEKHQLMAEVDYGWYSERFGGQVQYRNDSSPLQLTANVYRRVPPYRFERGVLVADSESGATLQANLPLSMARNAYAKDKLRFGFQAAYHYPLSTAGGELRPAPRAAWVVGPSIGYERTQLLPGTGQQELRARLAFSRKELGADLTYTQANLAYIGRFFAPTPRQTFNLSGMVTWFDGTDYSRREIDQALALVDARYEWRVADQVLGGKLWPVVHLGPTYVEGGYLWRNHLSGVGGGLDERDALYFQVRQNGLITRHGSYDLVGGNRTYIGGGGGNEWFFQFKIGWRPMPF